MRLNDDKVYKQGMFYGMLYTLILMMTVIFFYRAFVSDSVITPETELKLKGMQITFNNEYLYNDDINNEDLQNSIIDGYIAGIGDEYADYYSKEEAKEIIEATQGEYAGVGITVLKNMTTGLMTVVDINEGSPSSKADIKIGDILYKVDGVDVSELDLESTVSKIKGKVGTEVEITVYRKSDNKEHTSKLTRQIITVESVSYEMKKDKIGYIYVSTFDLSTMKQFKKAIEDLQEQGMKSLIIDLRDNGGGELETVVSMCDYILPEGTIMTVKYKNGSVDTYKSDNKHQLDIPIVVLVNEYSASASEVFTGALKDHNAATIVGKTTYGKGSVQSLCQLKDGSLFKFTIAEYCLPSGESINKKGIEPDIELKYEYDPENPEYDGQLEETLEIIKKLQK